MKKSKFAHAGDMWVENFLAINLRFMRVSQLSHCQKAIIHALYFVDIVSYCIAQPAHVARMNAALPVNLAGPYQYT